MFKKYRKIIFVIFALLLVCLLIFGICSYYSVPRLSSEEKELVRTAYINRDCGGDMEKYQQMPLIWYDENQYVEEDGVWRYVGTYGDCYAFLRIGGEQDDELVSMPPPSTYLLGGLTRLVVYPRQAWVYLYHTKREFNSDDANWIPEGTTVRLERTSYLMAQKHLDNWITEEQLEQLTKDIEEIAKEYN